MKPFDVFEVTDEHYAQLARADMSGCDSDVVDAICASPVGRRTLREVYARQEARAIAELRRQGRLPPDSRPVAAPPTDNRWRYSAPPRGRA